MVKSPRKMKNFLLRFLSAGRTPVFILKFLYPLNRKLQEIKYLSKLTPNLSEYYNGFLKGLYMYEKRTYRNLVKTDDLVKFEVIVKETDLLVRAERDLSKETREFVLKYRHQLETYIAMNPEFQKSLIPLMEDPYAPEIVHQMIQTSQLAHVGPMAAVAGAMAESVSKDLLKLSKEVIVENGGDIYLATSRERTIGIYAGDSPLSLKIGIVISPEETPLGVCTSSGTVGPSLSFGKANAVCILSKSAALADAAATAVGNVVKEKKDIELGLEKGREIVGVLGALIIVEEKMGAWGNIKLTQL
jgi:ApbE superfamily uncharacterized protein (UPF0280 family)